MGAGYNNLQATGAGWYYTWGTGAANPGNFDAKHYPDVLERARARTTINNIRNSPNIEYVLGFNEPERPDQANMTVAQAITVVDDDLQRLHRTRASSSSAPRSPTPAAHGGQAWLSSFMSQASPQQPEGRCRRRSTGTA